MFGLGMPEILLILAIALIVIGPQKLPELAKTLGRAMGEFKRSAQDLKRSIDMDTTLQDVKSAGTDLKKPWKDTRPKKAGDKNPDQQPDKEPDVSGAAGVSPTDRDPSETNGPPSSETPTADPGTENQDKNG